MGWTLFIISCVLWVLYHLMVGVTLENQRKMKARQMENERGLWEEMSKREFKETAKLRWELDLLRKALAEKQGQIHSRGVERKGESKAPRKLSAGTRDGHK